jgi:hypothetical protein
MPDSWMAIRLSGDFEQFEWARWSWGLEFGIP